MELQDARELIRHNGMDKGRPAAWADLGCGAGLFTYALAGLLPPGSEIYAVDKSPVRLQPAVSQVNIIVRQADFIAAELPLPVLDGVLMANSLHYVQHRPAFLQKLRSYLGPHSSLLMVEYDTDSPNQWVPYPLSYHSLELLVKETGYGEVQYLRSRPSVYRRADIYAALVTVK